MAVPTGRRRHGHGRELRGDQYVGETKNQLRDGYGVYNYENKFFRYEGEWKDGKKHGHGKLVMKDGSFYEGEFQNGEIEGHGYKYFAISEKSYTGQFHEGELHGNGIMKYKDGSTFEGEWCKSKRNGYGIFRMQDSHIYQGNFYQHKRHGEGTQTYENGDRYDGDWVLDKRQGHGELRCRDGTIYDGQWRNDLYNGEGTMIHSSGFIFEGLWVNGKPAKMAAKLTIVGEPVLELTQGQTFDIVVECHTEDGEKVEDNGRELSIMAGFRHLVPKEGTALFDMIEDTEEIPVETPFDYEIISFPLTDQLPEEPKSDTDGLSVEVKSSTNLSEQAVQEDKLSDCKGGLVCEEKSEQPAEGDSQKESDKLRDADPVTDEGRPDSPLAKTSSEDRTVISDQEQGDTTPLPPPVTNIRTVRGAAVWSELVLPAAPPMYRPYTILDDESGGSGTQLGSKKSKSTTKNEKSLSRYRRLGDERFARPGEYVIMVQDVTNPPFMDWKLEPAFLLIKLAAPKKAKMKKEKQQGKKWDTTRHIAKSMAAAIEDAAEKETFEYDQAQLSIERDDTDGEKSDC